VIQQHNYKELKLGFVFIEIFFIKFLETYVTVYSDGHNIDCLLQSSTTALELQ